MAKLGFHPGHILADLGAKVEELIEGFNQQACSNTLWALAVLQVSTAAYSTCSTSVRVVCRNSGPRIAGCETQMATAGVLETTEHSRQSGLKMHAVCPGCPA